MRKTPKHSRRRPSPDHAAVDIVSQLECAIRHPQAALIGALVGGLVPWFARTLAHEQLPAAWSAGSHGLAIVMLAVVLGCSVFSALSVYKFGRATFGDDRKAVGFAIAIEGVMLVAHGTTSVVALLALILINALANGAIIALARQTTCKQREADERRAATRRSRASRPAQAATPAPRRSPIPMVDAPATTARPAPKARVQWTPNLDDAIDAEIVSEQRLLA
jgi:hypothetical protein